MRLEASLEEQEAVYEEYNGLRQTKKMVKS